MSQIGDDPVVFRLEFSGVSVSRRDLLTWGCGFLWTPPQRD